MYILRNISIYISNGIYCITNIYYWLRILTLFDNIKIITSTCVDIHILWYMKRLESWGHCSNNLLIMLAALTLITQFVCFVFLFFILSESVLFMQSILIKWEETIRGATSAVHRKSYINSLEIIENRSIYMDSVNVFCFFFQNEIVVNVLEIIFMNSLSFV